LDIFNEQLVRAAKSPKRLFLKILIIVFCIAVAAVVLWFVNYLIAILLLIAIGWATWYLYGLQNVEYEYILTNSDLDIDKITAKRSRKRLITLSVSSFTDWKKAENSDEKAANLTVIDVSGDKGDVYIADCNHDRLGKIRLRFTPNAEFAENIEKVFPRELKLKLRQKNH
jgi:uncharacterized membrane protein YdbT with pleckstrin-like domain